MQVSDLVQVQAWGPFLSPRTRSCWRMFLDWSRSPPLVALLVAVVDAVRCDRGRCGAAIGLKRSQAAVTFNNIGGNHDARTSTGRFGVGSL